VHGFYGLGGIAQLEAFEVALAQVVDVKILEFMGEEGDHGSALHFEPDCVVDFEADFFGFTVLFLEPIFQLVCFDLEVDVFC
jgi:hypothetical protein